MKRLNLKIFRMKHGLTQAQMADKLGITQSHYKSIELGTHDPSFKVMTQLAEQFEPDDIWELLKKEG